MKRKASNNVAAALVKGAASQGQKNVASSSTQVIKTVQTSIPPNKYGQSPPRRKGR